MLGICHPVQRYFRLCSNYCERRRTSCSSEGNVEVHSFSFKTRFPSFLLQLIVMSYEKHVTALSTTYATSKRRNLLLITIYVLQGIGPRVLWIGIGGSIFFSVLESTKRLLEQRRPTLQQDSKEKWLLDEPQSICSQMSLYICSYLCLYETGTIYCVFYFYLFIKTASLVMRAL